MKGICISVVYSTNDSILDISMTPYQMDVELDHFANGVPIMGRDDIADNTVLYSAVAQRATSPGKSRSIR